ncbi:MAG: hypothetical protein MZW92_64330 [Comamonadaceae bacterium]|nr:hypothetical protein [Comamonadaceae bacterium]
MNVLYRKELDQAEDRKARAAELAQQYRDEFASPYLSAARGYITDVIEPRDTRWMLALALRKTLAEARAAAGQEARQHAPVEAAATGRIDMVSAAIVKVLWIFGLAVAGVDGGRGADQDRWSA